MPEADFSEDIPGSTYRSDFVQLSKKGDRIKFRIFAKPFYIGKHWIAEREAVNCPRINSKDETVSCEYCEKFEKGVANPHHRSGSYKPNLQFYYPIIDRETHEAAIFQTSISVHMAIKEAADAGIDVYKSDWQVTRNEGDKANYYGVVRLDAISVTEEERKSAINLKETVVKIQASLEAKESKMVPKSEEVVSKAEELDIDEVANELDEEIKTEDNSKKSSPSAKTIEDDDLLEDLPL